MRAERRGGPAAGSGMPALPLTRLFLLACLARCAEGAGVKLWDVGSNVEENPITVFSMFALVVALTITVELGKHAMEHKTRDPYRAATYEALYVEFMLIGVVSFVLILSAELGLTDVQIGGCDATPMPVVIGTLSPNAGSGSGSGSKKCGYRFDLVLFQYAHLALFFMGIAYCVHIQVNFLWRDRFANRLRAAQAHTLSSWKVLELSTGMAKCTFARQALVIRSAMVIEYGSRLRYLCEATYLSKKAEFAEKTHANAETFPAEDEAIARFNFAKYIKLMYSEIMVDLIHVPVWVWLTVVAMSTVNLVHMADIDLAVTLLCSAAFGPILSVLLWWRLQLRLNRAVRLMEEHPDIYKYEYHSARAHPDVDDEATFEPLSASESGWYRGRGTPWEHEHVLGDGTIMNPSQTIYKRLLQIVVFSTCFYVGQLVLLTPVTYDHLGLGPLLLAWLLPMVPLGYMLPAVMESYVLVFLTFEPTLLNLTKVLSSANPHNPPGHGHGHGGHDDHKGGHGHEHSHDSHSKKKDRSKDDQSHTTETEYELMNYSLLAPNVDDERLSRGAAQAARLSLPASPSIASTQPRESPTPFMPATLPTGPRRSAGAGDSFRIGNNSPNLNPLPHNPRRPPVASPRARRKPGYGGAGSRNFTLPPVAYN